jgi:hypothetical protein
MPKSIPMVREMEGDSFRGISVLVKNAETDALEKTVPSETGGGSALKANKRAWSQKLTESLAGELARRGADIRVKARVTLSVALPEIIFSEDREVLELQARAVVTLTSGWTKGFDGAAKIKKSSVFSSEEIDRLAGRALSEILKKIIWDAELSTHLGTASGKTDKAETPWQAEAETQR